MDWWTELVTAIRRHGIESVFRRYYSRYHAIVVDVDDFFQKRGRVLVKVPGLFGNQPLANWAEPIIHAGKASLLSQLLGKPSATGGKFCGPFNPPKVGDWIFVEFLNGHPDHPIYHPHGCIGDGEMPAVFDDALKWNMMNPIFISRYGHQIYVDESTGKAKFAIKMNNGHSLIIDETLTDQKIEIKTPSGSSWILKTDPLGATTDLTVELKGGATESYKKPVSKTYSTGLSEDITGKKTTKVTGKSAEEVTGVSSLKAASRTEDIDGNLAVSAGVASIESKGPATFKGAKQTLGAGGHPVPHGDTLKKALDNFCGSLSKLTPGSPANNAQAIAAIMQAAIKLQTELLPVNSLKTSTD